MLCIKDSQGRWLGASALYLSFFNLQRTDYVGKTDEELSYYANVNTEILKVNFISDKNAWSTKKVVKKTKPMLLNNQKIILETTITPIFDEQGNAHKLIITGYITHGEQRKKTTAALMSMAFESCTLSLFFLDKNFYITEANSAFITSTSYNNSEFTGKPLSFIAKGKTYPSVDFFIENPHKIWTGDLVCVSKNGNHFPIKLNVSLIIKDGSSVAYFANFIDISQQKHAEKRAIKLLHYDHLTGLMSRSLFYEKLRQFIFSTEKTPNTHAAVFLIDLSRFKTINESLGNNTGNELLKVVATRLTHLITAKDMIARMSGDEFAILITSEQSYEQTIYASSIIASNINQKLSEVIHVNNNDAVIGSSIGIAIFPEDCSATEVATKLKADILLKNADVAKNNAKTQGKNTYHFFNANKKLSQDKLVIELNLRKAIAKNELQLYYQPQYEASSKKLCGAEVLIRWIREGKMIPPDQFISIAEDTGLIIEIAA